MASDRPDTGHWRGRFRRLPAFCFSALALTAALLIVFDLPASVATPEGRVQVVGLLDQWNHYVPMAFYMDSAVHSGEIPLWNPLTFCGIPFAANPQTYVFYPPNLVRSLLTFGPTPMKTQIGLAILLGLHVLLAGISTFFLARDQKLGFGAALSAAFVFVLSATFVRRTMACHLITTVSWFPLILLLLRRAFVAEPIRSRLLYSLAGGTAFGMAVLAGFPQLVLYMALGSIGYAIAYRVLHPQPADGAPGKGLARLLVEDAVVGASVFVVGGLLAAAILFPGLELASFSERAKLENIVIHRMHSLPWLLDLFASYAGFEDQFLNYRLAGLGASLLVLAAFAHPRRRDVVPFAVLFYILLDCALGPPLPVSRLALWSAPFQLKDHSRAILPFGLPLAMLAGFGVEAVAVRWRARRASPLLALSLALFGLLGFRSLYQAIADGPIFPVPSSVFLFPGGVLAIILLAALPPPRGSAGALSRCFQGGENAYRIVSLLLPLLLFCELVAWGRPYVGYLRQRWGYDPSEAPLSERANLWSDNFRQADRSPNQHLMALRPAINGYDPLYIQRVHRVLQSPPTPEISLRPAAVLAENQRGNLFLKRSFWLARRWVAGPLPDAESLFPAATTVFLNDAPEDLPVPRVERSDVVGRSVSERFLRIPLTLEEPGEERRVGKARALVKRSWNVPAFDAQPYHGALIVHYAADSAASVRSTFRDAATGTRMPGKAYRVRPGGAVAGTLELPLPDFHRLTASLSVKQPLRSSPLRFESAHLLFDLDDENAHIRGLQRSFNSVTVDLADLPGPRILTFVDPHYPGWHAYVDGAEVPIHLANDAFKAVVVPPGTHRVRFEFRPASVYTGVAVSSSALLAIAAIFAIAGLRRRAGAGRSTRAGAP